MTKQPLPPYGLHTCCAPCLITAVHTLRSRPDATEALPARIIFYNPNIHPLLEFRRRIKALRVYLERDPLPSEIDAGYGLHTYLDSVGLGLDLHRRDRCRRCYLLRLEKTAEICRKNGLEAFSTTLLASREQDRELVAETGREVAAQHGMMFIDMDLRECQPDGKLLRGIYKQQYCGCIFSEEERFRDTNKHLYRDEGIADAALGL